MNEKNQHKKKYQGKILLELYLYSSFMCRVFKQ
jgi:hypothetical protein